MADDNSAAQDQNHKCPECPKGLPGWMATFSDLVTLLLTFFVLLLSFAKTESAKYEAALGSIRNALNGNVLKQGQVIRPGKSPDDAPTQIDSPHSTKPFPIEFLTTEGLLNNHEINRESTEDLNQMKADLKSYDLAENVNVYEMAEGIKVELKDVILFKKGSDVIQKISIPVFEKLIELISQEDWTVFVQGHSSRGEVGSSGEDAYKLSSNRAIEVTKFLIQKGVRAGKITTVAYGDSRPQELPSGSGGELEKLNQRVDFIIRKTDLRLEGNKVDSQ